MKKSRIAIISDIHGNLQALEAVLVDIAAKSVDQLICLGDMIGKGPQSKEVVDICFERCDEIVKGNWEDFISNPKTELTDFIDYYRNELGNERLERLYKLPEVIGFWMSGRFVRLFHANPDSLYDRVYSDSSLEKRLQLFNIPSLKRTETMMKASDVVGYGDIHGAYLQHLNEQRVLFNVGSVGNSCDSIPMASYVILEGILNETGEQDFSIQFYRIQYDKDLAIKQVEDTKMPNKEAYIRELKTGLYCR